MALLGIILLLLCLLFLIFVILRQNPNQPQKGNDDGKL